MGSTGWQKRLDSDFPDGLLMTWQDREDAPGYLIARPQVVAVREGQPVVSLDTFGAQKNFTVRVVEYTELTRDPLRVRVVGHNYAEPMIWSAGIPADAVEALRTDRDTELRGEDEGAP